MPLLGRYLRQHPDVKIELSLSDRLVDLIDESFEAVIRIGPLDDSSLVARPLAAYRLIACAAPAYLAEHGTPQTPDDLEGHHCLGLTAWPASVSGGGRCWGVKACNCWPRAAAFRSTTPARSAPPRAMAWASSWAPR
ncbi:LysR substrate-binding domain-containing protein [Pseudomonas denitrificans (nom. rej.)]|uniref:LysR substrate-binding domain-containing protein n=1 Tax=Pseudomonas denitrificans TaxID=43306 RepID=UPI003F4AB1C9